MSCLNTHKTLDWTYNLNSSQAIFSALSVNALVLLTYPATVSGLALLSYPAFQNIRDAALLWSSECIKLVELH